MEHLSNQKKQNRILSSWSWGDIQKMYAIYGKQLQECAGVAQRIEIPSNIDINYSDNDNVFILRFWREVKKLDAFVAALDREIARRNALIGVI